MLTRLVSLLTDALATLRMAVPLRLTHTKTEWRAGLSENLAALDSIVKAALAQAEASRGDLTPEGEKKAVARIVESMTKALAAFEARTVTAINNQVQSLERVVFEHAAPVKPAGMSEEVWEMRKREVRDQLRGLDPLDRDLVYATASDPLVIAACEQGPLVLVDGRLQPFLNPQRRTAAVIERAREAAPEQAAELDALRALAEVYATEIAGVRNALAAAYPEGEPIRARDGRGRPVVIGA